MFEYSVVGNTLFVISIERLLKILLITSLDVVIRTHVIHNEYKLNRINQSLTYRIPSGPTGHFLCHRYDNPEESAEGRNDVDTSPLSLFFSRGIQWFSNELFKLNIDRYLLIHVFSSHLVHLVHNILISLIDSVVTSLTVLPLDKIEMWFCSISCNPSKISISILPKRNKCSQSSCIPPTFSPVVKCIIKMHFDPYLNSHLLFLPAKFWIPTINLT